MVIFHSFPVKNGDFPISYVNVYQRVITFFFVGWVRFHGNAGNTWGITYGYMFFLACLDMVDGIDDGFYRWFIPL